MLDVFVTISQIELGQAIAQLIILHELRPPSTKHTKAGPLCRRSDRALKIIDNSRERKQPRKLHGRRG
ncbi:hypothetical protein [Microbacterium sp. VKM Ac-2923]|uniref:hypothetical protein n=1 Tax=Microbacterium sp. VKM Ac-2923 TaxID=2929476 RepID=UPI001FB2A2B4|nr:hypothetical protein [Microbacterium sp. VKM Ac-2923]MCJ1707710.1 hypothetical protein [Microbacterium sp. VKM Ac-2923]